jgi:hypothetical protein
METVRMRSRLIALLAVVTLSLGVGTAGSARADDSGRGTCILLSARLVGSSGGRYHAYDLKVRVINLRRQTARIVEVVSNQYGREHGIGATVGPRSSATRATQVYSPHGSTFRVTGCIWSPA